MKIRDPDLPKKEVPEVREAQKPDLLMNRGGQRLSVFINKLKFNKEDGLEREITKIIDDQFLRRVKSLLMSGHTIKDIATIEGLSLENFHTLKEKIPELQKVVESGKTAGISNVKNSLYKKVLDKDCPPQFLFQWLYIFGGLTPPNRVELRNTEGEPLKSIELKPDQRIKRIEELKKVLHRCGAVSDKNGNENNLFDKGFLEKVNKNKEKIDKVLEVIKGVSEDDGQKI